MAARNLFGLPGESHRVALLIVLFIAFAIPVTLVATLEQRQIGSQASACYDLDGDGVVKTSDTTLLGEQINDGDYAKKSDFNSDGAVDEADLALLRRNLNRTCIPKISFFAEPAEVPSGQEATLNWSVEAATSVTIDGVGSVGKEGTRKVTTNSSTTYTLTATGPGGTVKATTEIKISP